MSNLSEEEKQAIENLKKDFIIMNNGEIYESDDYILYNLIDRLQKELEQEKEKNFKRSDMIFQLKSNNTYLKDRVTALENSDLTIVYMSGFYDGEKKWKGKIKDKIKELEEETKETFDKYGDMVENKTISVLESLLEGE